MSRADKWDLRVEKCSLHENKCDPIYTSIFSTLTSLLNVEYSVELFYFFDIRYLVKLTVSRTLMKPMSGRLAEFLRKELTAVAKWRHVCNLNKITRIRRTFSSVREAYSNGRSLRLIFRRTSSHISKNKSWTKSLSLFCCSNTVGTHGETYFAKRIQTLADLLDLSVVSEYTRRLVDEVTADDLEWGSRQLFPFHTIRVIFGGPIGRFTILNSEKSIINNL